MPTDEEILTVLDEWVIRRSKVTIPELGTVHGYAVRKLRALFAQPEPDSPKRRFIDDLRGHWYVIDDAHRGEWERYKREAEQASQFYPDSPPNYARRIYRNKPRAVTFVGGKIEECT